MTKKNVSTTVTKTRDYSRRGSNNNTNIITRHVFSVLMEQGSSPIPFVSSHASALPGTCLHQCLERRGESSERQLKGAGQGLRSGHSWNADVWWHLVTRRLQILSSAHPLPPFLPLLCQRCLSNPLPLLSSQIWLLLLLLLLPGLKDEVLQMHWYVFLHCYCAVGDKWMQVRGLFLFKPRREPDFWLRPSGIMAQTDITAFVERKDMKVWKECVQQVRRPPSDLHFQLTVYSVIRWQITYAQYLCFLLCTHYTLHT